MSTPKGPKDHWYPGFDNARQTDVVRRRGHLSSLAEQRLALLLDLGLHAKERSSEEEHLVLLGERRQPVWLKFGYGTYRWGVERVKVEGETSMEDTAIIAALTNTETAPIDIACLKETLPNVEALIRSRKYDSLGEALERRSITWGDHGSYGLRLLMHFRPDLYSYPLEDQIALYEETCKRINTLLEASQNLVNFLEYGKPESDLRPEVEQAELFVNAAVLRDAGGMPYPQIGEELGIPPPAQRDRDKGDHPRVRLSIVPRGREILEQAFGKEGWKEKAEAMKAKAERRRRIDLEVLAGALADSLGLPEEEVRRNLTWTPPGRLRWLDDDLREKCLNEFFGGDQKRFNQMFR